MLRNGNRALERGGARLWLAGIDSVLGRTSDLQRALTGVPRDEPIILLAHEPDYADHAARFGIDLQLSGHSHGGQVRIPGVRPIYLPPMARKYYAGGYQVGALALYTTRGIGTIGVPFRFACPPEATVVVLRRKES
jgi:predicted MPP superfamily phosphohydrolase